MNLSESEPRRRNWDPVVKLTHWGVVTAVIANALFTLEGGNAHVWIGYMLAALLALRLLWGVIGPAEARFTAFPPSPRRALAHARGIAAGKKTEHASHNPLGAMMVYAIWGTLAVIIATGIGMAGLPNAAGGRDEPNERNERTISARTVAQDGREDRGDAFSRRAGGGGAAEAENGEREEEGPLSEIHEVAVNLLYLLIALHLAGVIFETRRSGREIVLAMSPGRR